MKRRTKTKFNKKIVISGYASSSLTAISLLGAFAVSGLAHAAEAVPSATELTQMRQQLAEQAKKLAEQQQLLNEELKRLETHKKAFENTQRQLEALQRKMGVTPQQQTAQTQQAPAKSQQTAKPQAQQRVAQTEPQNPPTQPVGIAPAKSEDTRPPAVAPIFEQPGILTQRGKIVLEPAVQLSYSSSDKVSIVGLTIINTALFGLIDVRSVSNSNFITSLTARYGVTNRLELEARIPFIYRTQDTVSRPISVDGDVAAGADQLFVADGSNIGDIEFAARYQINIPEGNEPYYIAGIRLKTRTGTDPYNVSYASGTTASTGTMLTSLPTGSGFYGIQPSLSVIYPTDPAVFFGGINYLWNMKRNVNKTVANSYIGTVEPGDALGFNLGMGVSINEKSSFSLGYEHTFIQKTKVDGISGISVSSQVASLLLGFSYRLNDKTNINLSIAAGLTPDAPNASITLRVPYTF